MAKGSRFVLTGPGTGGWKDTFTKSQVKRVKKTFHKRWPIHRVKGASYIRKVRGGWGLFLKDGE